MIKKLFAFQQLLFCSEPFRTQGAKSPNSAITWIYIFLVVGSFILFTPIFSGESSIVIIPMLDLVFIYLVINRSNKVYELVPVSINYVVRNIFLLAIVFPSLCYLGLCVVGYPCLGIIFLIVLLSTGGNVNIFSSFMSHSDFTSSLEGAILVLLIMLIAFFVVTALSFIKKKKLRIFAIACFSVLFYLSLLLLKFHITAISTTGYTNFVNDFQKSPNAHFILFCLGVFFIIIAPVSIFAGQWFYKCRFKI